MQRKSNKSWGTALAAAMLASGLMLPQARAELVPEQSNVQAAAVTAPVTVQAPTPVQAAAPAQAAAPVETQEAQATALDAGSKDPAKMSKLELMRRERMREEVKNEDVLQERLEELRLRDEKRRTDQVLGISPAAPATGAPAQTAPAQLKQEVVTAPATEKDPVKESVPAAAPLLSNTANNANAVSLTSLKMSEGLPDPEATQVSITPKVGIAGMNANGYDIRPHFASGVNMGVTVGENITVEAGYTYNEYGVNISSSNPFINMVNNGYTGYGAFGYMGWNPYAWGYGGYGGMGGMAQSGNPNSFAYETETMRQNVFEAGLKLHVLGRDNKFRPFIGGGGAYAYNWMNYNPRVLGVISQYPVYNYMGFGNQYSGNSYLGYLSGGFDMKLSKVISVGFTFKYYGVLAARETTVNNMAFYAPSVYPYYYGGMASPGATGVPDPDKQSIGGSLARSSFYDALAGLSFVF